jgi:Ca2+/Na+ antiporter
MNSITNELILKYDEKFNQLYNKKVNIDSSIMNKEELILKENDEIQNKEVNVSILQYTILFIILFGILLICNAMNKLTIIQLIIFTIILFFVYLFVIYFVVYRKISKDQVDKVIKNIKVDMQAFVQKVDPYKCPTKCSINSANPPPSQLIQGYEQPTLNIDPQANVWQYGDMQVDLYTSNKNPGSNFFINPRNIPNYNSTEEEQLENQPKSKFGTTYPSSTYYKCEWLGGNSDGLPNIEPVTYSSIPCSYRQNFEETGRYICNKNPNGLSSTDFGKACDNVSLIT